MIQNRGNTMAVDWRETEDMRQEQCQHEAGFDDGGRCLVCRYHDTEEDKLLEEKLKSYRDHGEVST